MIGYKVEDPAALPGATTLTCPHCLKPISVHTHAQAAFIGCPHCLKLYETRLNSLAVLSRYNKSRVPVPLIPLGTKGRIQNMVYAVVGFASFKETGKPYYWREYVLFSPIHGHALLAEFEGHWTFLRFISDYSHGKSHFKSFYYHGHHFQLYNRYSPQLLYGEGEFFWDITRGGEYSEYVAPPYMITRISDKKELSWMLGEYLEPRKVSKAFGLDQDLLPSRSGVGAAEPLSSILPFDMLKKASLIALLLLVALQLFFVKSARNAQLDSSSYDLPAQNAALPAQAGPTITIRDTWSGKANLKFELFAPVSNTWLSLGITLINTQTHQEYDLEMGVEYYSGYTGGENWAEGNQHSEQLVSALPAGTYQLILQPYRELLSTTPKFDLTVVEDVAIWSNFWITALLIVLIPGIQYLRQESHEKRRWMNSDFAPGP